MLPPSATIKAGNVICGICPIALVDSILFFSQVHHPYISHFLFPPILCFFLSISTILHLWWLVYFAIMSFFFWIILTNFAPWCTWDEDYWFYLGSSLLCYLDCPPPLLFTLLAPVSLNHVAFHIILFTSLFSSHSSMSV